MPQVGVDRGDQPGPPSVMTSSGGRSPRSARPADIAPLFYEPTVLADVTDEMTVCRAETFGPVVSVYRVRDSEAIARQRH